MNWLVLSTIAYFLIAFVVILDKFLLSSRRISHPAIYTFYSGVLSSFALLLFPFGAHMVSPAFFAGSVFAGIIFVYGILFLFFAIKEGEVSRVTPVVGAIIPIITYLLSVFFLKEVLNSSQMIGVLVLVAGGLLISFELQQHSRKWKFFSGFGFSVLAGVLLAIAFTFFKRFYEQDNFINVFVWTRLGLLAGALSLLSIPSWRKKIFLSIAQFKRPKKENKRSGLLFVFNKILGGTGSIMLNYSIALGSVTIVNALVSLEYAFVFLLGISFSFWLPEIFQEKKNLRDIIQKIMAIIIIAAGVFLVSK